MISAKVTRKDRLFAKLRAMVPASETAMAEANTQSAEEMLSLARSYVPVEHGALRASLRQSPAERGAVLVEAGGPATTKAVRSGSTATFDYALGQEYGTAKHPAQPFFWPAYRLMRTRFRGRASRALNKALKAVVK